MGQAFSNSSFSEQAEMTFESAWWSVLFRVLAGVLRAQSSRYMALTRSAVAIAATAAVFAVLHALQAKSPTSHPCSRRHINQTLFFD